MKKYITTSFFLLSGLIIYAQKENVNWFFGDSLMMKFTDTGINTTKVPGVTVEASSSISDKNGNLIFYSDGKNVWNRNFELMENSGLNIDQYVEGEGSSITQGILTIPNPADTSKYYLFYLADNFLFEYAQVDMILDGGFGDISSKNLILLNDTLMEKMQAVKHGNGRDWWIIIHEYPTQFTPEVTNKFYEFLVTPDGISSPIDQSIGHQIDYTTIVGQMIFSPDGTKLAMTGNNFLDLFTFNRCTGELRHLSYIDNLSPPDFSSYGCSFSPDGSKLYISNVGLHTMLYQYCLDCTDSIESTKQLIFDDLDSNNSLWQHELGPDGKIYIVYAPTFLPAALNIYNMNLSVINSPNAEGLLCDLDTASIWLGGLSDLVGLPNMPNYNLGPLGGSECDTLGLNVNVAHVNQQITIYPNPAINRIYIAGVENIQANNLHLEIYNILGDKIFVTDNIIANKEITLPQMNNGIYEAVIKKSDEVIYSEKLILLN